MGLKHKSRRRGGNCVQNILPFASIVCFQWICIRIEVSFVEEQQKPFGFESSMEPIETWKLLNQTCVRCKSDKYAGKWVLPLCISSIGRNSSMMAAKESGWVDLSVKHLRHRSHLINTGKVRFSKYVKTMHNRSIFLSFATGLKSSEFPWNYVYIGCKQFDPIAN